MADATYQPKVYRKQGGDELVIASGGTLTVESGATLAILNGALEAPDMALATGSILLGTAGVAAALDAKGDGKILIGNGTTAAMQSVGTDATLANTGALTIAAGAVTLAKMADIASDRLIGRDTAGTGVPEALTVGNGLAFTGSGGIGVAAAGITAAMLANGAGVAALLTAGLGGSQTIVKTETGTKTIVAADATKDRACIVVAVVTEAFATGDNARTLITVGEADTPDKMWDNADFPNGLALGTVLVGAFTNLATKAITITSVAAAGTGTGGVAVTVLAIPTT